VILAALAGAVAGARVLRSNGSRVGRHSFTPAADSKRQKGTRPDFSAGSAEGTRRAAVRAFLPSACDLGVPVETGVFGAYMQVELVNDGPVTIILEAEAP
jgi:D-tyrosyl-tRNA(Tyr) deacylase